MAISFFKNLLNPKPEKRNIDWKTFLSDLHEHYLNIGLEEAEEIIATPANEKDTNAALKKQSIKEKPDKKALELKEEEFEDFEDFEELASSNTNILKNSDNNIKKDNKQGFVTSFLSSLWKKKEELAEKPDELNLKEEKKTKTSTKKII